MHIIFIIGAHVFAGCFAVATYYMNGARRFISHTSCRWFYENVLIVSKDSNKD